MNNYFLVYFDMFFVNKASEGLGYNIQVVLTKFMMLLWCFLSYKELESLWSHPLLFYGKDQSDHVSKHLFCTFEGEQKMTET